MENLLSVAMILSPMLLGFAIRLPKTALRLLDKALDGLVYAILWLIGIGLSQVDNLVAQLDDILFYSLLLFVLTMACNLAVLMLFDRRLPFPLALPKAACTASGTSGSFKQLLIVAAGIVYGIALPKHYLPPTQWSTYVLMLLMLVVGLQVRGNGITLRQILLNPRGIQIAVLFILSCLCAGCFFARLAAHHAWVATRGGSRSRNRMGKARDWLMECVGQIKPCRNHAREPMPRICRKKQPARL